LSFTDSDFLRYFSLFLIKSGAGAEAKRQGNSLLPAARHRDRQPVLGPVNCAAPVFISMINNQFHWENESGIEPIVQVSSVDGTPPENSRCRS
jgi:hypothetical protein